jgi:carboxyl-terminal processing protease
MVIDEGNKNMNEKKMVSILGIFIIVILCSSISFIGGRFTNLGKTNSIFDFGRVEDSTIDSSADIRMFWTVWNTMKNGYVDSSKADSQEMIDGAIKGMVNSFEDPATLYFTAEETDKFNKQNSGKFFEGIGAELGYRDGLISIVTPINGSPAQEAGLLPGDAILKVDGVELKTTDTVFDAVDMIRGDAGTTVVITIYRKGELVARDVSIVRGEITLPAIEVKHPSIIDSGYSIYDDSVAVLSVSRFTDSSLSTWENAWDEAVSQVVDGGYRKLILDLRNNPGGYFDAAIYAAEDFLPKGTVVAKQQDKDGRIEEFKVSREGNLLDIEMIVLVNDGSASASEILAGALKQSDRAEIYGINTYGKGTAQNVIQFEDGSSLHITIMKWLLPNGDWINLDNPIVPDVEIMRTEEDFKKGFDPQFDLVIKTISK